MSSKRLHLLLMASICLLFIGLLGGAYGVNKLFSSQAAKLTELKAKSLASTKEQTNLKKAKQDIITYSDLEKVTKTIVPEDKSQAEAVRQIVNIAGANGISLSSVTFPASTLGVTAAPKAGTTTPATPPTPNPSASATTNKAAGLSQLQPVKNIPGVYLLTITVTSDPNNPVLYNRFINFLSDLEHNRRTAQVSTITIQPDVVKPNFLSFILTINEYIKP